MTPSAISMEAAAGGESGSPETAENRAFGFWLYIMSDLVLFAALFATYAVLGHNYAGGPTGKDLFHLPYVFAETMILLLSSATYGLAMLAATKVVRTQVLIWLAITFMLGLLFVTMEVNEFHRLILAGHGPQRSGFLSAYFTLVGTHGTHVAFGLLWIAVMAGQVVLKGLTGPVRSRLMRLSIFWHFLDIVWVGVFTMVYLMGVM
jgi:cytochrome o ubiquinol oxidase subunit III